MANIQNIPIGEKLRISNPKVNQNFQNLNTELTGHIVSKTAHKAEDITYTGQVPGDDVKEAIDNVNGRISEIVAQSGNDNTEIVDARGGYPVLSARLDDFDTKKANRSEVVFKGDIVCNVKDFGAVGDNINDDTDAIVAAINSGASIIFIPPGTFKVRPEQLVIGSSQTLKGAGTRASLISIPGLNSTAVTMAGMSSKIEDLQIVGDGTAISGEGIRILSSVVNVNNVYIRETYVGLSINGPSSIISTIFIKQLLIEEPLYVGLLLENANDVFLDQFIISGSNTNPFSGIRLLNKVEAFSATNGDVLWFQFSLTSDATVNENGARPAYNKFTNVYFDSSENGVLVDKSATTRFVNCWFSNRPNNGCTVQNSTDIEFDSCDFINNGSNGLIINATAKRVKVRGGSVQNNNSQNNGSNGINIAPGTTDFIIQGVTVGNNAGFPGLQQVGININTGASDRYIVSDNLVFNNSSVGVADNGTGTNKRVANNY